MKTHCTVTLLPEGVRTQTVECSPGETLLDVLNRAGIAIKTLCGGAGTCHRCLVKVEEGEVEVAVGGSPLPREQVERGLSLACQLKIVGDATIQIPASSLLTQHSVLIDGPREEEETLLSGEPEEIEERITLDPLHQRRTLKLEPPSLVDNTADLDRIVRELTAETGLGQFRVHTPALRNLAAVLRESGWEVAVSWTDMFCCGEIADVSPPGGEDIYGLAVDIGTTTVAVQLVDLASGNVRAVRGEYNRQARFGEDVIARINHASQHEGGLAELHRAVVDTVNRLIDGILAETGSGPDQVRAVVCAGNTTMIHTLLELDPNHIRRHPYTPTVGAPPPVYARELDLRVHPAARLFCFPAVGSFVGGDIVAGVLTTGLARRDDLTLFVDIGTNGEIVLGNGDFLMGCSASAGPAFEGGGISCGSRAVSGAIERVEMSPGGEELYCQTINGEPPVGLCGTGLIDVLATLQQVDVINRSGQFNEDLETPRLRTRGEDREFVLVWAEHAGTDRDIAITSADINNLMRAKAAVYAAIKILLNNLSLEEEMIDQVLIAGGFGNNLNIDASVAIGLLPDLPRDRFRFVGNSALQGAREGLLSRAAMRESLRLAQMMTYLELSSEEQAAAFMDQFVAAQFIPHTDLNLFPSARREATEEQR
ncbi:MAG: ASKHA domain-containing protein [Bacillota bacterium]